MDVRVIYLHSWDTSREANLLASAVVDSKTKVYRVKLCMNYICLPYLGGT